MVSLVNWYFEPSQPLRIISGLKETFIKRYIVERTNKAEIRPREESERLQSWTFHTGYMKYGHFHTGYFNLTSHARCSSDRFNHIR